MRSSPPERPSDRLRHATAALVRAAAGSGIDVELPPGRPAILRIAPVAPDLDPCDFTIVPWSLEAPIRRHRTASPRLWVLQRAPVAVHEELRRTDQSYVDLTRRIVRLRAPGLLIERSVPRAARADQIRAGSRNPFSDRASLVTRTLLATLGRTWTIQELARSAEVSPALTSRVVEYLASEHLVKARTEGAGRHVRLPSPWPLFKRWTEAYRWSDNKALTVAAPLGDPRRGLDRVGNALRKHDPELRWAFTGQAGAALVAPHATWETVHCYLDLDSLQQVERLAKALEWAPASQGRLVLLIPRYRHATWWHLTSHDRLPVVHSIQLMLDLWHYPVRGREAAEHIARRLGWRTDEG